ncbi:MAG: hypothetical protein M1838_005693 [Thelocarpon superellum]|nr:MAG: hypothetical protein M1838_005693 [Thelocarpon superellum]
MSAGWPRGRGPGDDRITTADAAASQRSGPMTSYFLADEEAMEAAAALSSESLNQSQRPLKDSSYGVQSLGDTVLRETKEEARPSSEVDDGNQGNQSRRPKNPSPEHSSSPLSAKPPAAGTEIPPPGTSQENVLSRQPSAKLSPMLTAPVSAPRSLASPTPSSSRPSSPKSFSAKSVHPSDAESSADESTSQAVGSSGDEDGETLEVSDSMPQLIMPSIKMPSRRPFTEKGRAMGRLKVLIAGQAGVGKTSLIKSIVQVCEDIVHVDPLTPTLPTLRFASSRHSPPRANGADQPNTTPITEVYASTRPYPAWWSEFDESAVLRRRKSLGDSVLERNLCFIDTPGYGHGPASLDAIQSVIRYVEGQLERTASLMNMGDGDIMGMLSGSGGPQVDVVFYLFARRPRSADLEYLRRLAPLTNIVPIVAQADRLDVKEVSALKANVLSELQQANVRPFLFGSAEGRGSDASTPRPPYAISSAMASDPENMDASLLMSSEYVQPLQASELGALVAQVFERDTVAWLRHCAAKKFLHWLRGTASAMPSPRSPLSIGSSTHEMLGGSSWSSMTGSPSLVATSPSMSPALGGTSYALARIADHTQRENHMAQVRLAKWASDLQRSLQNERERFERLAQDARERWLTEKMGECVRDGSWTPGALEQRLTLMYDASGGRSGRPGGDIERHAHLRSRIDLHRQDPLGLLEWAEGLHRQSWVALQVVGGFGIVGGIALWVARSWGAHGETGLDLNWTWWGGGD